MMDVHGMHYLIAISKKKILVNVIIDLQAGVHRK